MSGSDFITRHEFNTAMEHVSASHKALSATVQAMPAEVARNILEQRRADRRRFWRNTFAAAVGVSTIVGSVATIVALVVHFL